MFMKVQLHHPGSVLQLRGHTAKAMYEQVTSVDGGGGGGGGGAGGSSIGDDLQSGIEGGRIFYSVVSVA